MPRPPKDKSPDQMRLLAYLRDVAPGPRTPASVSVAEIARAMGWSVGKVKILRRSLVDEGLLEVRERRLPNGGQTENAYRLTRAARRRLKAQTQP